ncbi:MAG: peptidoglycan glycosyltransferase [Chloroflexi bacterium]|nr:peptidoglycan glycosyltransferase [Chloroflexota bacterium]
MRMFLPKFIVLLIFVVLSARLYQIQMVDTDADRYRYSTSVNTTRYVPIRPIRGEIYASDGKTLLAENMPIYTVAIQVSDLPPEGSVARTQVFAQLSQVLGITNTLTISPAIVLDNDKVLRDALQTTLGEESLDRFVKNEQVLPLQITVNPEDLFGATQIVERHAPIVRYVPRWNAPIESDDAALLRDVDSALADLSSALEITGTLVISPAMQVNQRPELRNDLIRVFGEEITTQIDDVAVRTWLTGDVLPSSVVDALRLSEQFTRTLTLENPIEQLVRTSDTPRYQTIIVVRDVPRTVAMVLKENTANLPGVVIEQDYRRRYPLSSDVQSISHVLGYIGRVGSCELVRQNPARSWVAGLLDSIGNSVECGILQKKINPFELGIPRYLNNDQIGKSGIEASYEEQMRGQMGIEAVLVDNLGRPVRDSQVVQPTRDGDSLILTIDIEFQRQVEQIMRNWIREAERRRVSITDETSYKRSYLPMQSGAAVVIEVNTGRILAMTSWPAYDNNIWVDASRADELVALLNPPPAQRAENQRLAPLTNRVISGQYPPGSTLKQFDAVIALQEQIILPTTKIRDPGELILKDQYVEDRFYRFVNAVPRDNGWIDVTEALMRSSNIFFMTVAGGNKEGVVNLNVNEQTIPQGLQINKLADGLTKFGFGQPTGVKMFGEQPGRVPTPGWKQQALRAAWTTGDTYNASIGQGNLEATPLQLAMAGAAIANNGKIYRPQIVKAIVAPDGRIIQEIEPELIRTLDFNPAFYEVSRIGMRRSVVESFNVSARQECSGLLIAGKTGTAEFGPEITVRYPNGTTGIVRQSHSWFMGFAPYDNPQIQVVFLSEGSGDMNDGSSTIAVPAVTQIMQAYFGVTGPTPLPAGCQRGMLPLPDSVNQDVLEPSEILDRRAS